MGILKISVFDGLQGFPIHSIEEVRQGISSKGAAKLSFKVEPKEHQLISLGMAYAKSKSDCRVDIRITGMITHDKSHENGSDELKVNASCFLIAIRSEHENEDSQRLKHEYLIF